MNDGKIKLDNDFQLKMFRKAMDVLAKHYSTMSLYNKNLYEDLADGFALAGEDMTITVKQMNHIKTLAVELETKYG